MKITPVKEQKKFQPFDVRIETEEEAKALYMKLDTPNDKVLEAYTNDARPRLREVLAKANTTNMWQAIDRELDRQEILI